jgi:hypothetical protein
MCQQIAVDSSKGHSSVENCRVGIQRLVEAELLEQQTLNGNHTGFPYLA